MVNKNPTGGREGKGVGPQGPSASSNLLRQSTRVRRERDLPEPDTCRRVIGHCATEHPPRIACGRRRWCLGFPARAFARAGRHAAESDRSSPRVAEVAAGWNGPCRIQAVQRWSPDRIAVVSYSGGETTDSSPASSFHWPLNFSLSLSLSPIPASSRRRESQGGRRAGNFGECFCSPALLIFLSRSPLPVVIIHRRCACFCCCQIHFVGRLSFSMDFSYDLFFCNISGGI